MHALAPLQHGTCIGGKLTRSKAAFFGTALDYTKKFTRPGTAAQRAFSDNAGKNVTLAFLNAAYSAPLINQVRLLSGLCRKRVAGAALSHQLVAEQLMGPKLCCSVGQCTLHQVHCEGGSIAQLPRALASTPTSSRSSPMPRCRAPRTCRRTAAWWRTTTSRTTRSTTAAATGERCQLRRIGDHIIRVKLVPLKLTFSAAAHPSQSTGR